MMLLPSDPEFTLTNFWGESEKKAALPLYYDFIPAFSSWFREMRDVFVRIVTPLLPLSSPWDYNGTISRLSFTYTKQIYIAIWIQVLFEENWTSVNHFVFSTDYGILQMSEAWNIYLY